LAKVSYVQPDGSSYTVEAASGNSVMQTARNAGVAGIVAICGGNMMCGTCHVRVDEAWTGRAGSPGEDEAGVLEALDVRAEVTSASRLACEIRMSPTLDGLIVHVPRYQPGV
jgi:2Fe-2S ferredoxin